ncbi:MAG: SH3 domain-containing protein [Anaerolineaceae bacterium]|nr:SH3 domain-containing protein [Anaerolineaceae bacterium]
MNLPTSEPIFENEEPLPPARRRQQRRHVMGKGAEGRAQLLDELGRRVIPGADFYISALLSGLAFGIAMIFDSPALALLAVLLAPFMGPALGLPIASLGGSLSFLFLSSGSLLIGGLIYFLTGTLSGVFAKALQIGAGWQAVIHLSFTWFDLALVTIGVAVTAFMLARSTGQRPLISSVAIAYVVYLPLGAAGFGLTSGLYGHWAQGLALALGYLLWGALVAMAVFALFGLRPARRLGFGLAAAFFLISVVSLGFLWQSGAATKIALFIPTPTSMAVNTLPTATSAAGEEPSLAQTATGDTTPMATEVITSTPSRTPTLTLTPTRTPTPTMTLTPTPAFALVAVRDGNGALVRSLPSFDSASIKSVINGTEVELLPEIEEAEGATWVKVRLEDGTEGWIVRSLLATVTPIPNP